MNIETKTLFSFTDHADFLQKRLSVVGVGGSDISTIKGCGFKQPFELWLRLRNKMLGLPVKESAQTKNMLAGNLLERAVKGFFEIETGVKVDDLNYCFYKNDENVFYTPDGVTADNCLFEAKAASSQNGFNHIWGFVDIPIVPERYFLQCQYGMEILGLEKCYLAVLFDGLNFKYFEIDRVDLDLEKQAIEFIKSVIEGQDPPAVIEFAQVDWSSIYPVEQIEQKKLNKPLLAKIKKLHKVNCKIRILAKEKEEIQAQLKSVLGYASVGLINNEPAVSWKANKNGNRVFSLWWQPEAELKG